MDLRDAAAHLRVKLQNKSFRKAVGATTASAIEALLKAYECGGWVEPKDVAELVNNYYIFESRIRRILELYDKLAKGSLRALIREVLGEDLYAEPLEFDLLLRELENYRKYLFSIAERVMKCYSSTNSKA